MPPKPKPTPKSTGEKPSSSSSSLGSDLLDAVRNFFKSFGGENDSGSAEDDSKKDPRIQAFYMICDVYKKFTEYVIKTEMGFMAGAPGKGPDAPGLGGKDPIVGGANSESQVPLSKLMSPGPGTESGNPVQKLTETASSVLDNLGEVDKSPHETSDLDPKTKTLGT